MSESEIKDYISGIRRGRNIERQTQRANIILAGVLGFALGIMSGVIICLLGIILT